MKPPTDIASFLKGLSSALIKGRNDLSVVQFGSSVVQQQFSNGLDIDLLLLSSIESYQGNFNHRLRELKQQMVSGKFSEGFEVHDQRLADVVASYLADHLLANINFIPRFVFGPIATPPSIDQSYNVYLHFKGPITPEQFLAFSNLFPFHARSILNSSKKLAGQFDHQSIELEEKALDEDFKTFSDALAIRATLSINPIEIRKCLRKLIQNLSILNGVFFSAEVDIFELLYEQYGISILNRQDVYELKNVFFELRELIDKPSGGKPIASQYLSY